MPLKNVIWIKLYLCLLDNDDFMDKLTDEEKWYYVGMLLLYPKHGKKLVKDGKYLGRKLSYDGHDISPNLNKIIKVMKLKLGLVGIKSKD